ncbi:MAG: glycosyltransferase family 4 protein [Ignavibacteria bacterium]|jgi:glycosyltransferase involved in cell wall biosynthesis|nr:glycosyltransferase family 4 protein [Ignavibacteria bacterium]
MRILLIANIRKSQGGITTQVLELAESLNGAGITTELISTHGSLRERLKNVIKAYSAAKKCDLIISAGCSYLGFFPIMVSSLIGKMRRKKIIYNFHDGQVEDFLKKYYGIVKLFIGNAAIIVATDFLKKSFINYGFKCIRIFNHFNNLEIGSKALTGSDKIKVIWARSFEKLYDPDSAIIAAIHYKNNPDVIFHFYGTGKYLNYYKEKYGNHNLKFYGFVNREALLMKYKEYNIFLNTALYDNFPMSIVEAGMNNLIVISSKTGGIPTIYSENEIIFYEPGNTDDLLIKLDNVISNPENYSSYADRLSGRVTEFKWENVKAEWMKIINNQLTEAES